MRCLPSLLQSFVWRRLRGRLAFALIGVQFILPAPILAADLSGIEDRGITATLAYDGAVFTNFAGGMSRASTYSGNLNVTLTLDLERMMNWSGTMFYANGLWIHGGQPSNIIGDAQG